MRALNKFPASENGVSRIFTVKRSGWRGIEYGWRGVTPHSENPSGRRRVQAGEAGSCGTQRPRNDPAEVGGAPLPGADGGES